MEGMVGQSRTYWVWTIAMFAAFVCAIPFGNFAEAGNVLGFVPAMIVASVCYFGAAQSFVFLPRENRIRQFWWIALALRLLALAIPAGDDVYRYLWEGRIQWHGYNPYLLRPDSPLLFQLRDADWILINHRDWAAIYPPGAELLLRLLTMAGPSVMVVKLACAAADIAVIVLLLRLNTGQSRYRDTIWYAWNPLVVYSFAGAGHLDSLMLAPLLLSVYALTRAIPAGGKPADWSWATMSALVLGIAISIKIIPLVLVLVFAIALRSRMVVLPLAALVPWISARWYGFPENRIFDTFREFAYVSRFNDFIWWISERFIWANLEQKNGAYTLVAIAAAALASVLAWHDWRRATLWVMGVSLIFATVVHPWYLTWILPFAAMRKAHVWFVLSGTVFLAFLWWETTPWWQAWQPSPLLSLAISLPPLIFGVYEILKARAHNPNRNGLS